MPDKHNYVTKTSHHYYMYAVKRQNIIYLPEIAALLF